MNENDVFHAICETLFEVKRYKPLAEARRHARSLLPDPEFRAYVTGVQDGLNKRDIWAALTDKDLEFAKRVAENWMTFHEDPEFRKFCDELDELTRIKGDLPGIDLEEIAS